MASSLSVVTIGIIMMPITSPALNALNVPRLSSPITKRNAGPIVSNAK